VIEWGNYEWVKKLLYLLLGQDDFSRRRALEGIKKDLGEHDFASANITQLEGQQLSPAQLRNICETVPFLSEKRLVIVEGLLSRFEPKGKFTSRKKPITAASKESEYKAFADGINQIPESTILILVDGKLGKSNPLLAELSASGEVKQFPLLSDTGLRQWIQKQVKAEGGSISTQAVDLLVKLIGSNLWIMSNEINKLVILTSERRIEVGDVQIAVSYAQESNVFAMVDAILGFQPGIAEKLLQQLLQHGAAPAYLLFMLARQFRLIVRARDLQNRGEPAAMIQTSLGLPSGFVWHKTLEQASRHPLTRVIKVYHKLLETDLAIKTGKYDSELALNILIAELGQ
jgi:DNA polymerase-3 subunit delta